MADKLIFRQDDWSNGIGDIYDPKGLAWCESWVGGKGWLSPKALVNKVQLTFLDAGYIVRHGFVEKDGDGDPHLYIIADDGTDSQVLKMDLSTATFGADQNATTYSSAIMGHPARYKGNWYYTELGGSLMRKLTTAHADVIANDTLSNGDAGSGDGHLFNYGHQLAKVQKTAGIEILSTGGDANLDADWSSPFPVGDSVDSSIGGASVRGLAYVLRGRGLFTFNDRARSGSLFEDFSAWQLDDIKYWSIEPWKGGIVFTRLGSIYYWNPGSGALPVDISIGAGEPVDDKRLGTNLGNIQYTSVAVIGNYLYVGYDIGANSGILFGKATVSGEKSVAWYGFLTSASTIPSGTRAIPVTASQTPSTSNATTYLFLQTANRSVGLYPLNIDGSPITGAAEQLVSTAANSATLPYIELHGEKPTKVRIAVEGMVDIGANPTTHAHITIKGDFSISSTVRPIIGRMFANGVHEFRISPESGLSGRLSLELVYTAEAAAAQTLPPVVRWVEVYAEE